MWSLSALLATISIFAWWSHSSYFEGSYTSLLVFTGNDGWCDSQFQGFGLHCWGDYAALRFENLFALPSGPESLYPLGGRLIRLPFMILESSVSVRAGVLVFLSACLLSCLAPLVMISKSWELTERLLLVLLFGFLGLGVISSLDRGNTIALTVSPLFLLCRELLREVKRPKLLSFYGTLLVLLKPQMAVFFLVFLTFRNLRQFISPFVVPLGVLFLTQFVLGGGIGAITSLISSATSWSGSLPITAPYPTNLSANKIAVVLGFDIWWLGYVLPITSILLIVIACRLSRQPPDHRDLITAVMSLTIFGQIVYVYYSVLAIVAISLLGSAHLSRSDCSTRKYSLRFSNLVVTGAVATNAPLAIGSSWIGLDSLPASNAWSLVALLLVAVGVIAHGLARLVEAGTTYFLRPDRG